MTEHNLVAEVSTTADADTTRVEVAHAGDDRIALILIGDGPGRRGTLLTPNEARRLGEALTKAAAAPEAKRGGTLHIYGDADLTVPTQTNR